jgi:3-hydroxybutyryl-CoA dehydrogenase
VSPPAASPLAGPVLIIGGGTMGTGIAACLVAAGIDTVVQVRRAAAVGATRSQVTGRLARLAGYRLIESRAAGPAARLTVVHEDSAGPFAVAVESVAEDLGVKRAVLRRAEAVVADDGVLATITSSLRLGELAEGLARPGRFAGWHWFNPAELVPLVEVVGGPRTAPATLRHLTELAAALGKQPITVRHDVPGFVANRLQYALLREAYALVEADVCDVADIDRAVVSGLGARWAGIGPFAAMDAAGLDVHEAVAAQLFPQLSRDTAVPGLLRRARERGATGVKGGHGLCGAYPPAAADRLAARRDDVLALLSGTTPGGATTSRNEAP